MNDTQPKTIEGWINKASNQLQTAREHAQSAYRCSEAVQAAQQCVELSVKSILSLLNVTYPRAHEWAADKAQFAAIAKQIQDRKLIEKLASQSLNNTIPLPRLLLLVNFWGQFYLVSKYGFEAEQLASAQDLFQLEEAKLAVRHADECYYAASALQHLDKEKLAALLSGKAP